MVFDRLLDAENGAEPLVAGSGQGSDEDAAALRETIAELESMDVERRRSLAGIAYILVRVARADGDLTEEEVARIEETVIAAGGLSPAQGALLVALSGRMSSLYGSTQDYAVTREFARTSSPQDLQRLLRACVTVATADGPITAAESAELDEVGLELGFRVEEIAAIRDQVDPPGERSSEVQ